MSFIRILGPEPSDAFVRVFDVNEQLLAEGWIQIEPRGGGMHPVQKQMISAQANGCLDHLRIYWPAMDMWFRCVLSNGIDVNDTTSRIWLDSDSQLFWIKHDSFEELI